jgi:hypothetical protein
MFDRSSNDTLLPSSSPSKNKPSQVQKEKSNSAQKYIEYCHSEYSFRNLIPYTLLKGNASCSAVIDLIHQHGSDDVSIDLKIHHNKGTNQFNIEPAIVFDGKDISCPDAIAALNNNIKSFKN